MRTLQLQISELLLRLFLAKPPTLRDSVCVCFCFKDNSSISITQPALSGYGGFFGYESDYGASRYINHREKQFLLLRKAILPFWFICHYIWTFLYLHYVHVAFTQYRKKKIPKHKCNKKEKSSFLIRLKSTTQKEYYITLALRNAFGKRLCCLVVYISSSQWDENNNSIKTHILL